MKITEELRKEFEETELFAEFNEKFDIYYTNLGGYRFQKDDKPYFYLNGALAMYVEVVNE